MENYYTFLLYRFFLKIFLWDLLYTYIDLVWFPCVMCERPICKDSLLRERRYITWPVHQISSLLHLKSRVNGNVAAFQSPLRRYIYIYIYSVGPIWKNIPPFSLRSNLEYLRALFFTTQSCNQMATLVYLYCKQMASSGLSFSCKQMASVAPLFCIFPHCL